MEDEVKAAKALLAHVCKQPPRHVMQRLQDEVVESELSFDLDDHHRLFTARKFDWPASAYILQTSPLCNSDGVHRYEAHVVSVLATTSQI